MPYDTMAYENTTTITPLAGVPPPLSRQLLLDHVLLVYLHMAVLTESATPPSQKPKQ
jgi:hypothetical protein